MIQTVSPRAAKGIFSGSTSRPQMGAIAESLADRVLLTSDNPRDEAPGAIVDQIVAGMVVGERVAEFDKEQALSFPFVLVEDAMAAQAQRLRFIAGYLDNQEDRAFIEGHADSLRVAYQRYDWRLNQY